MGTQRANTLTVRLTDDETKMLDVTCDYVRRTGRTVLGEPNISRADALRKLAAVGYTKVERAMRRDAATADAQAQAPASDTTRTPNPADAPPDAQSHTPTSEASSEGLYPELR